MVQRADIGFQSTHPVRGATTSANAISAGSQISIHAPRAGCDLTTLILQLSPEFQSTHPVRGATGTHELFGEATDISIHAPRAGCDPGFSASPAPCTHFNPRTPCGVRPHRTHPLSPRADISIHAPRAGCDEYYNYDGFKSAYISIHAPRAGCDIFRLRFLRGLA